MQAGASVPTWLGARFVAVILSKLCFSAKLCCDHMLNLQLNCSFSCKTSNSIINGKNNIEMERFWMHSKCFGISIYESNTTTWHFMVSRLKYACHCEDCDEIRKNSIFQFLNETMKWPSPYFNFSVYSYWLLWYGNVLNTTFPIQYHNTRFTRISVKEK